MNIFLRVALLSGFSLVSTIAAAQEPPPSPQMPATPSLDQKGSDDMSRPAGAAKPVTPPEAGKAPFKKAPARKAAAGSAGATTHQRLHRKAEKPHAMAKPRRAGRAHSKGR